MTKIINELSTEKLRQYKTKAAADASRLDRIGATEKSNRRFRGIVKATNKQFKNEIEKSRRVAAHPSEESWILDGWKEGRRDSRDDEYYLKIML